MCLWVHTPTDVCFVKLLHLKFHFVLYFTLTPSHCLCYLFFHASLPLDRNPCITFGAGVRGIKWLPGMAGAVIFHRVIDPDYVLDLDRPTPGFLCPIGANTYGIDFLSFTIGALVHGFCVCLFLTVRVGRSYVSEPRLEERGIVRICCLLHVMNLSRCRQNRWRVTIPWGSFGNVCVVRSRLTRLPSFYLPPFSF